MERAVRRTPIAALLLPIALVIALVMAGCASTGYYQLGREAAKRGDWDNAVLHYSRAVEEKPGDIEIQIALDRARIAASNMHFEKAKDHLEARNLEPAVVELQQAVNLNPANQFAFNELQNAVRELKKRHDAKMAKADEKTELERLKETSKQPIGAPPKLSPVSDFTIDLYFEEKELSVILEAVGKTYGINFLYDESVRQDSPVTLDITGVSFEEALELVMLTTGNTYTVISENTLMVYPDTQAKRREWEDQVIKTFYLSNADVNDVNALLRTLIDSRRISINKQLNAISIRDTLDKIAIADRIIQANDKAKAEVIIDMDLMQVDRSKLKTLGIDLTTKSALISFDDNDEGGVRLNYLNPLGDLGSWILGPIPSIQLDFLRSDSVSKQLAQPQVRATEGEKVSIHIGDQVPIPNTTFSATQTVGGNIVPITSYTYQNVGIQVQLEPRVHHNKEITLRIRLEVSNITAVNESGQPTIGTREVETVIRLKDGETNLLAGLLREDDVKGISTVPGIGDIPGLKHAFGQRSIQERQTDIVLALTPHIIRIPDITETDLRPLWVGTERNIRLRGKAVMPGYGQGPFGQEAADEAWDVFTEKTESFSPQEIDELLRGPEEPFLRPEAREPGETAPPAPPEDTGGGGGGGGSAAREPAEPEPPAGPVTMGFVPPATVVGVGESVSVELRIDSGGQEIGHAPLHVLFDPAIVEVVDVQEGGFLRSAGRSTFFQHEVRGGRLVLGASLVGTGGGASGTGTLAVLVLQGRAQGRSGLKLDEVHIWNPALSEEFPAAVSAGSVDVR